MKARKLKQQVGSYWRVRCGNLWYAGDDRGESDGPWGYVRSQATGFEHAAYARAVVRKIRALRKSYEIPHLFAHRSYKRLIVVRVKVAILV